MNVFFQVGWTWYPSIVIGFSLWTLLYVWATLRKKTPRAQLIAFHFGTLVGLLALVSPLDELGDAYLFSAHMVQHLLLMFVAAPLWLIGTPGWLLNRILPGRFEKTINWLVNPMVAFGIFVSVMWFWHIPVVYGMALENETIHIIEHLTFIGAALIGWWPVAGSGASRIPKLAPPLRILFLFFLAIPCTGLAAILTFAHTPLYSVYVTAPHTFGLDALQDLHLGGLLMWLPTHMILLLAIGITFFKWFMDSDRDGEQNMMKIESVNIT